MSTGQHTNDSFNKLVIRAQVIIAASLLLLLPVANFFFPSAYGFKAGIHGVIAISALVVGTYLTHRAVPWLKGVQVNFESLRRWLLAATLLNLAGAISGNWIYMRYRGEDGPRDWILGNVPVFHTVLMEFKEFVSLFPFPLMLLATFMLYFYGLPIQTRRDLTRFVGVTVLVAWSFLLLGFVAGLVLAKLRFV
ncbi:MAG: hypothetical protein CTY22_00065 [Methylomonas sp.]|nr:MAG: hypothetical protein CTY23_01185 [Methylomonas sp.]PPD27842.1 MAG: hypothetical protein CTY22_00065 [Methylomonas sp.]PPD39951.1 MAG: hypothetical protein CTY21_00065 [Methylomonas sp.]PPD41069.1 MAG: hypothetical protein CTY17_04800 [Methylomonas sp.]PPD52055.1 MAG: hypothetical protein CTY11_10625 [Methylomonas sp.]